MNIESEEQYRAAKEAFMAGVGFAEVELGDVIADSVAEEAFIAWLDIGERS